MKRLKNIIMVLVGISLTMAGLGCASYGPSIPRVKIPPDIPSDVRKQIERLYSSDPIERADGAYELGEMSVEATPAIPFLIGMLDDDTFIKWTEWEKRRTIAGKRKPEEPVYHFSELIFPYFEVILVAELALVKIGKPAIEPLVAALKDEDSRMGASWALSVMKDPHTVEPLIAALKDEDSHVRWEAVNILGEIKDPRAVEPLIATLKDEDFGIRRKVAEVLGEIKDPRAVEPLIAALKDENLTVRKNATSALGEIKDPRAVEPLITILGDKNSVGRREAALALGEIKDPRAVEPLIVALKDEDLVVREKAALALGEIKDPRAVEPLIVALKGEDWIVIKAVWALGKLKDPRAVEPLTAALKDKDSSVRWRASLALRVITGQDFGKDPAKWQEWWEENKGKFNK